MPTIDFQDVASAGTAGTTIGDFVFTSSSGLVGTLTSGPDKALGASAPWSVEVRHVSNFTFDLDSYKFFISDGTSTNQITITAGVTSDTKTFTGLGVGGDSGVFSLNSTAFDGITSFTISADSSTSVLSLLGIDDISISNLQPNNNAPVLGGTPADDLATEDVATAIDLSAYNVSDADGDTIKLTLNVNRGTIASIDGNGTTAGVTVANSGSASMTLQGTAANLNTYLNDTSKITFTTTNNDTTTAVLTVTPNDGMVNGSADTVNINVTPVNDDPTATGIPSDVTVTEDTASNIDLSAVSFADVDENNLTVTLNVSAGAFSTPADGAGVGAGVTETLQSETVITLVGTPSDINTYLDTASNIRYTTALNVSGNAAETVNITMNDGDGSGNLSPGFVNINVTPVNDDPTVPALPASVTVNEDTQSNITLDAATFADIDGDNITVTLTASAGTFASPADGAIVGGGVTETLVNGTTITLVGAASDINTYLDTASNIQYTPVADLNGTAAATITVVVNDGAGSGDLTLGTVNIDVTAVNDTPVFAGLDGTPTFTEGGSAQILDADVRVADVELSSLNGGQGDFSSASLVLARDGGVNANDVFSIQSAGSLTVAGSNISAGGNVFATFDTTSASQVTISFTSANGTTPTTALVTEVMQAIAYANGSDDPAANVQINWAFSDGNSANAQGIGDNPGTGIGSTTVTLTNINDAPTLSATGGNPTFTEDGGAQDLFNTVTASTIEAADRFTDLSLTVTNVSDGASEILSIDGSEVTLVDGTSLTTATTGFDASVSVMGGVATIILNGTTATNAQIATLVDGLSYRNTSQNPTSAADRVVTVTGVTDNGGTSNGGVNQSMPGLTSTVAVVPVNDAPVVTNLAGDLVVLDPGTSANIDAGSDASVTEPGTGSLNGGSLQIMDAGANNTATGNFSFDGTVVTAGTDGEITTGETVSVNGMAIGTIAAADGQGGNDLTINFTGVDATQARVQTLLQNIEWGAATGNGDQTFTLTLDDNGGTANGGASSTTADFTMRLNFTPEIDNLDGDTTTFVNAGGPLKLDTGGDALLSDMDTPADLQGGVLTASVTQNARTAQDLLGVDGVNVTLSDTIAGSNVLVGGTVIGALANDLTTGADLMVDLNADATLARVQTLLQNITYDNTAGASPIGGVREISLTVSDGQGATSDAAVVNMTVIAPPPPPPAPTPTPAAPPAAASVTLANVSTELLSGAAPSDQSQLVAIITTTGEGTAVLAGADADLFEINGSSLFLRAGVDLSGRVGSEIEVSVTFGDASNDLSLPVVNTNFPGTGAGDELTGTPFADFFDGGDGVDTVVLPGMIGGHTITFDAAATTVEDRATAVIDTLLNIETITFDDGESPVSTLDLTLFSGVLDTSKAQLEALSILYVTLFDRTPDAPGLFFWATQLGNGQSFENIAQQFLDSPEFAETYGADADQASIVAQVYENLLDRAQDEAGATFWNSVLSQGGEFGLDDFVLAFVAGAQNNAEDRQAIEDQADISLYFSATQGLSDPTDGNTALNTYEIGNREETLAEAQALIDSFAASIDDELLLKVTGIVDDPFAIA